MALDTTPGSAGATKLGRYELVKELSGSGVGSTWVARAGDDTSKAYQILRLHRHLTKNFEIAEAFLKEARLAEKLKHENAIGVVETGVNDGEVFVVSEYFEGELLSKLITSAGAGGLPLPVLL